MQAYPWLMMVVLRLLQKVRMQEHPLKSTPRTGLHLLYKEVRLPQIRWWCFEHLRKTCFLLCRSCCQTAMGW